MSKWKKARFFFLFSYYFLLCSVTFWTLINFHETFAFISVAWYIYNLVVCKLIAIAIGVLELRQLALPIPQLHSIAPIQFMGWRLKWFNQNRCLPSNSISESCLIGLETAHCWRKQNKSARDKQERQRPLKKQSQTIRQTPLTVRFSCAHCELRKSIVTHQI